MYIVKEKYTVEQALILIEPISNVEIEQHIGLTKDKLKNFINKYCKLNDFLIDGIYDGLNCIVISIDLTNREKELMEQIKFHDDISTISNNLYVSPCVVKRTAKTIILKLIAKFYPKLVQIKK